MTPSERVSDLTRQNSLTGQATGGKGRLRPAGSALILRAIVTWGTSGRSCPEMPQSCATFSMLVANPVMASGICPELPSHATCGRCQTPGASKTSVNGSHLTVSAPRIRHFLWPGSTDPRNNKVTCRFSAPTHLPPPGKVSPCNCATVDWTGPGAIKAKNRRSRALAIGRS